jgi:hypothetical protein
MDKTVFTSGNFAFSAFDDNGILSPGQRIKEYFVLKISNIPSSGTKIVRLNHPQLSSDILFLQLRINKTVTQNLSLQIDIYRGNDFIDRMVLGDADIPYQFKNGSVLDPHGHEFNNSLPIEFRITSNRVLDSIYFIGEKCFVNPIIELLENY